MTILPLTPVTMMADATAASNAMKAYITPALGVMVAIAGLAVVFFLVYGGIQYMSSSGDPEKLGHAKKIIRNALIGLVLVIAAGALTAILTNAYHGSGASSIQTLPKIIPAAQDPGPGSIGGVIAKGIAEVLEGVVKSVGKPFLDSLKYFTETTPLMADNPSVFNLWLVIVGIADVLFIAVVALLGFHIMGFASLGLDEIEFKHLLPQLACVFLLINISIFAIDAIIGLSNGMIGALRAGFPSTSVWKALLDVIQNAGNIGLGALLVMAALLVLSIMLLIYYVLRLVVLYLGAVLSPLIFLIWLLPAFKDFAQTAIKVYITTIFVLFVHVVILSLAASIFTGMAATAPKQPLNPIMSMIVGLATILALLKTQGVMSQLSYVSLGPKTARRLGGQVTNAMSYFNSKRAMHKAKDAEENSSRRQIPQGGKGRIFGKSETVLVRGHPQYDKSKNQGGNHTITASSLKTGQTKRASKPTPKAGK